MDGLWKLEKPEQGLPWSLQREYNPAGILVLAQWSFWPLEL
jgi:hypothetical protein